jgi:hypothetical protein
LADILCIKKEEKESKKEKKAIFETRHSKLYIPSFIVSRMTKLEIIKQTKKNVENILKPIF